MEMTEAELRAIEERATSGDGVVECYCVPLVAEVRRRMTSCRELTARVEVSMGAETTLQLRIAGHEREIERLRAALEAAKLDDTPYSGPFDSADPEAVKRHNKRDGE